MGLKPEPGLRALEQLGQLDVALDSSTFGFSGTKSVPI